MDPGMDPGKQPGSDPGIAEVKKAVDELGTSWEEYQRANDERLKQIEEKGSADPLLDEKLAKMDARFDVIEEIKKAHATAQAAHKAADKRMAEIETALKRAPRDTGEKSEKTERYNTFFKYLRFGAMMEPNCGSQPLTMEEVKSLRDLQMVDPDDRKALSVANEQAAGYLAPIDYIREIIKATLEFSPMRELARVRPTSSKSIQVPKRTGNFGAVWVAEQATRSETTGLTYGIEEIPNHELYALVDISEQMLEDSAFDLEGELQLEFSEQFGIAEGTAFVTGNGSGKPQGILDNAAVGSTNSGSAATIADTDGQANGLIDLYHAIKTAYARNATWVLNRTVLGSVRKLKDGNNNYIWQPGLASLRPATILDQPYVEMTDMPNEAANAFPIAFGDFRRGYTIVDRVQMSVLRDPFTQATSGNIRFVARRRVGGQVVLAEAIRKLKCSA